MAAAGPVGIIVAATVALVELTKAGIDLAYSQEEHARKLAEMSPSQAANVQQLDYSRMIRDFEKGEATAGTSGDLMQSIDRFEDAMAPIETAVTNILNVVGSEVMDYLEQFAKMGGDAVKLLERIPGVKKLIKGDDEDGPELMGDFMKRVYEEEKAKQRHGQQRIDDLKRGRDNRGR